MRVLPSIPVTDLGSNGLHRLLDDHRDRFQAIHRAATRRYTPPLLALADRLSRAWSMRADFPYREEVAAVEAAIGVPGAWLMNLNYEWGCTCALVPGAAGGNRLLRVLDWQQDGLGRTVVAARRSGPAGPWMALTWPGFVGCVQGMAPGRFAASINQAPAGTRMGWAVDWVGGRVKVWRNPFSPPALLLRRVFDSCPTFAEARRLLAETPVCAPVIFTLAGTGPGEAVVIERLERSASPMDGAGVVTNHWLSGRFAGRSRAFKTEERLHLMRRLVGEDSIGAAAAGGFPWLLPPILNDLTRLVMDADPRSGRLRAQGFEADGPVTEVLDLEMGVDETTLGLSAPPTVFS